MNWRHYALVCLLAMGCCTLTSCDNSAKGHATPQAAAELATLQEQDLPALEKADIVDAEVIECFSDVLDHFARTMDVHYADPHTSISILHLACLFKKNELARCLLIDGADPNKHAPGDDSPLLLAVGTYLTPQISTQDLIALVDTLLAGGAKFELSGPTGDDFLTQAAYVCENEDVILYLLDKGAKADANTALPLALHGWTRALSRVVDRHPHLDNLLHTVAVGSCHFKGNFIECLQQLLDKGADINGEEEGITGISPIFRLSQELIDTPEDSPHLQQALDVFEFMVQHGANPYLRGDGDENYPGFCAYDFVAMRPYLMTALKERGIELQAPQLTLSSGPTLPAEICRVAMLAPDAEELAPHFDSIASLLTPSPDISEQEIYPQALEAAIGLLCSIDPTRASQRIQASPLWQKQASPHTQEAITAMLTALRDNKALSLPQDFICRTAEQWVSENRADDAAALVELLARCPHAEATIEKYCHAEHPALQAGAYAARLYAEGLPDARNNGVAAWLLEKQREADTPFLREAVLLTSLEKLWYGQMPPEEQQGMLDIMTRIGATSAADAYKQIAAHLDSPDKLDEIMQQGDTWKFELEVATARFFLEHKHEFLSPAP